MAKPMPAIFFGHGKPNERSRGIMSGRTLGLPSAKTFRVPVPCFASPFSIQAVNSAWSAAPVGWP